MTPQFRFTIFNSVVAPTGVEVNHPFGWDQTVISISRDKTYHSLIEHFKDNFIWYGYAMQVIEEIANTQGPDAKARILVEISYKRNVWKSLFDGNLDLIEKKVLTEGDKEYKITVPIIRDDFWAKFINRKSTPVSLTATTDLDGGSRTAINKIVLPMPSQKLRERGRYISNLGYAYSENEITSSKFAVIDFDTVELDEIDVKYTLTPGIINNLPASIIDIERDGTYQFEIKIEASLLYYLAYTGPGPVGNCVTQRVISSCENIISFYMKVNNNSELLTKVNSPFVLLNRSTQFIYTKTLELKKGDQLTLYGDFLSSITSYGQAANIVFYGKNNNEIYVKAASSVYIVNENTCNALVDVGKNTAVNIIPPSLLDIPTYMNITADTVYPDSETDAFLIKDAAESILSKLVGQDSVVISNYFSGPFRLNALFRGKHLRGNSFSAKELFMSFDEWYRGADPILCLGFGYKKIGGVNKFQIEDRSFFYNKNIVVKLDKVTNITRSYDSDRFYRSIKKGYNKWSAESSSGTDDPQSVRTYRTRFATIGKDLTDMSSFFAASSGIEQTRRNRVDQGKDWRLDEDIMIVALVEDGINYLPEFGTVFNTITNLIEPNFRINIRHSVARVFKRFQKWYQSCLQFGASTKFFFASGEGNYDMTSKLEVTDYEATDNPEPTLSEKQDIDVTADFDFIPYLYEVTHPMSFTTYETILQNKENAIGISRTTVNHVPMHIIDLDYAICDGSAKMLLLSAENELV